ncbi:MAG: isoprenylcysteine carboxylmethyltransferase family protein [bacterium]
MFLQNFAVAAGHFLFRWRGYTPVVVFPLYYFLYGRSVLIPLLPAVETVFYALSGLMVVAGQLGRILTVGFVPPGTSGRNTRGQVANDLNTTGAYSISRNPLYVSNFLMFIGLIMTGLSEGLVVLNALIFLATYRAIVAAEEGFLAEKFGAAYADFMARVPRFWPRPSLWQPPRHRFELLLVIRREHDTIMAALLFYTLCIHVGWFIANGQWEAFPAWLTACAVAAVPYSAAKFLSLFTNVLARRGERG